MDEDEKDKLVEQLRERMSDVKPLPHEDFFTRTDTLLRFLKAREWNLDEAEKQLKETVEWRREIDPLNVDCRWCHERPGYHCIRQVGFDRQHRPVMYACFAQATCSDTTVDDTVVHMTHLFENAKKVMTGDTSTWVLIIDCTGMTLAACNPRLGHGLTSAMGTYYPERLGLVICIHHNPVFQGVWNAFKIFLDPNTAAKMQMLRKKSKFREAFFRLFDEELAAWLMDEVKLNKRRPMLASQQQFWKGVSGSDTMQPTTTTTNTRAVIAALASRHDPRGCPTYVRQYIEPYLANYDRNSDESPRLSTLHHPHPNIIDQLRGTIATDVPAAAAAAGIVVADSNGDGSDAAAAAEANSDDDDDDDEILATISLNEISEQFQIPQHIYDQHQLKQ